MSAPPSAVAGYPLGVDLSMEQQGDDQHPDKIDYPALAQAGKVFVINKAVHGTGNDPKVFSHNWNRMKSAGLMRGSYSWFLLVPIADQVKALLGAVPRLVPGDLPPSVDIEAGSLKTGHPTPVLDQIQDWLNQVEKAYGRQPIIYTGWLWRDDLGHSTRMSDYPLWTPRCTSKAGGGWNVAAIGGWTEALIWQYAEDHGRTDDNSDYSTQFGVKPYVEPGVTVNRIDFDAFNGTLHQLRGLADLGRTAPFTAGNETLIVHCDVDGHIHCIGSAGDSDLWDEQVRLGIPDADGDPSAANGFIVIRGEDGHIYEINRGADGWTGGDISPSASPEAVHDPTIFVTSTERHVFYWNDNNHLMRLRFDGQWHSDDLTASTSAPDASGQAIGYLHMGPVHAVGRAGHEGHLFDLWSDGSDWQSLDLTGKSADSDGKAPPSATYRPATYHLPGAAAQIVFRAVGGAIWQITRDSLLAVNLSDAAGAPTAIGAPAAAYALGSPRIVFRGLDGSINELYHEGDDWSFRDTGCTAKAAADPSITATDDGATASYRAVDGTIHTATLSASGWVCS